MNTQASQHSAAVSGGFSIKPLVGQVCSTLALGVGVLLPVGLAHAVEAQQAQVAENSVAAGDKSAQDDTKASQDASKQDGFALPAVTVTSQKREENVQDIPDAVTILSGKEILDKGIGRSASEVLNYVPNASAATQQHGRPRWWIRGVGAGQQQWDLANPVGFYLDEVYIANASATGLPLFDVERVEVLRGPQGTLWGKNTTGGAISVISKKPSFNESPTDNYVKLDYGSYDDRIYEGGIGGVILDERLAGRLSFHQQDYGGPFKNEFTGGTDGKVNDGVIRGQLLASITPDLEALLGVHYRKYDTDGAITTAGSYASNGVFRNGYAPSTNRRHVSTNADNNEDSSQNGARLNLKWQLGKYALTAITGYEYFDRKTLTDTDYTPLEISRGRTDGWSRQFSQELRIASPREDRWNWLAGLHYFNENIQYETQNAQLPPASVASLAGSPPVRPITSPGAAYNQSNLHHKDTSFAIFGSNTYNFTDQWNATLGLRWTHEKKDYNLERSGSTGGTAANKWSTFGQWWNAYNGTFQPAGTLASGTFNTSDSKTWNHWTYDFTPEYKITPTDRIFFKYAHGVKAGGFNTAATSLAAVNVVDPEQLDDFELGYKSEWLGGKLNFNATAFHYIYKDVQVNVVGFNANANATVSYLQNAKKAHVNGAEFELEALPIDNLHVKSSIGLLDAKFDDFEILNNGGNLDGNQLVRSPHVTANLSAEYQIPLANGNKVVIGTDGRYTGKQYYFVTPQSEARHFLSQDAFTIVDARIAFTTPKEKYTWTAYVNNVFDKKYANHALPANNPSQGVNGDFIYWAPPRAVGLSFITNW